MRMRMSIFLELQSINCVKSLFYWPFEWAQCKYISDIIVLHNQLAKLSHWTLINYFIYNNKNNFMIFSRIFYIGQLAILQPPEVLVY